MSHFWQLCCPHVIQVFPGHNWHKSQRLMLSWERTKRSHIVRDFTWNLWKMNPSSHMCLPVTVISSKKSICIQTACKRPNEERECLRMWVITNIALLSISSYCDCTSSAMSMRTNKFWLMACHNMFILSSLVLLAWQLTSKDRCHWVPQGLLVKETRQNIILCLQETKQKSVRMWESPSFLMACHHEFPLSLGSLPVFVYTGCIVWRSRIGNTYTDDKRNDDEYIVVSSSGIIWVN